MDQATFNEVGLYELRRLIGSERYKYNFIVYDIKNRSWGVLHISNYETTILQTDGKNQQPIKRLFDLYSIVMDDTSAHRFFIEPRGLGVSLTRIVLQQALRGASYTGAFSMVCEDNEPHYETAQPLNVYGEESIGVLYNYPANENTINEVIVPARKIIDYARRIMKDSE